MKSSNNSQSVLDLFCGAGGLTLGCEKANYDVIAGVDNDKKVIKTYNKNFSHQGIVCNLASVQPSEFSEKYNIRRSDVDIIVGGPPCQSFSLQGSREKSDTRSNLVFRFAKYVNYYKPNSFVMENVRGIKSYNGGKTFNLLCDNFTSSGYEIKKQMLNAAKYGVPQKRKRVFIVGVHEMYDGSYSFPEATHGPQSNFSLTTEEKKNINE